MSTEGCRVQVQEAAFNPAQLQDLLPASGAVVTFTGNVRDMSAAGSVHALQLEHYPGMTERSLQAIASEATVRWSLRAVHILHRVGRIEAGESIVWVGVCADHRGEAFAACEFIMDALKTRAPFWKKEHGAQDARWVEARDSDISRAERWQLTRTGDAGMGPCG
ncbi:molybdenum cofactor biosynthesis protein MoaE [Haliea sp.]|uniref:molybdenum cofactor biosynthesis protein MoaE n=1 Tax=Haliea sp. TaxID=1932666 RepID=UPI003527DE7D